VLKVALSTNQRTVSPASSLVGWLPDFGRVNHLAV